VRACRGTHVALLYRMTAASVAAGFGGSVPPLGRILICVALVLVLRPIAA
jgi:hypothetical protein